MAQYLQLLAGVSFEQYSDPLWGVRGEHPPTSMANGAAKSAEQPSPPEQSPVFGPILAGLRVYAPKSFRENMLSEGR